ncbi:MAG TPA: histidinol-phosphate transaminase [Woeseiaceae bacterium]|nr:histidinol-phosphate transaminase [Woeseiaceae bacterium]
MSDAVLALARPEIRALKAYQPAGYAPDAVRLNANEAPWRAGGDASERGLNRYPEARPAALTALLAAHYDAAPDETFVTRGSSEAIDLLIRCFCRPGRDDVVICPPTFGMYQVYADIQNAGIRRVPLSGPDFRLDVDAVLAAWDGRARLLFLTSPNNPTGTSIAAEAIARLCDRLAGRGVVVLDAAYVEFAAEDPCPRLLAAHDNLVVLRTLSKAYGLAGARCGVAIGRPAVVRLLGKVMPPYAIPTPTVEAATAAVVNESFRVMPERIRALCAERERVRAALTACPGVLRVWPSDANFLLVRFRDSAQALALARETGLLLRDFGGEPGLENCLRITIGETADNDRLLAVLGRQAVNA